MSDMREHLMHHISMVLEGIRHLSVEDAEDLLSDVSDGVSTGERTDDLFNDAILDGIRWGYAAAVEVEMAGGAMLRVVLPGGVCLTHQWTSEAEAQPQIRAALGAVGNARAVKGASGDD